MGDPPLEQGARHDHALDQDPDEGEAFTAARRFALPAVERIDPLLLEDVGVPLPRLAQLVTGIAERDQVLIPVLAHAGDGNTHPLIVHDPAVFRALPDIRHRSGRRRGGRGSPP
ncbi:FAD-linked oxidase C-terminal domain-containing protein [Nocardia arizonensis]|uniref:FAD-linked oxidase C-terminal domain-containing protein n=1 Tax=Nocardia arizonensis TaxID=1141647 RepID=UPI0006D049AD